MGKDVIFDYSKAAAFIHEEEIAGIKAGVQAARETLVEKTGAGNDFLGWIDLPVDYDKEEFGRIKKAAEKIQKDSDVLLVIGIGGSYLGARAAIEFLSHSFYNNLPKIFGSKPSAFYTALSSVTSGMRRSQRKGTSSRFWTLSMPVKPERMTKPIKARGTCSFLSWKNESRITSL